MQNECLGNSLPECRVSLEALERILAKVDEVDDTVNNSVETADGWVLTFDRWAVKIVFAGWNASSCLVPPSSSYHSCLRSSLSIIRSQYFPCITPLPPSLHLCWHLERAAHTHQPHTMEEGPDTHTVLSRSSSDFWVMSSCDVCGPHL